MKDTAFQMKCLGKMLTEIKNCQKSKQIESIKITSNNYIVELGILK